MSRKSVIWLSLLTCVASFGTQLYGQGNPGSARPISNPPEDSGLKAVKDAQSERFLPAPNTRDISSKSAVTLLQEALKGQKFTGGWDSKKKRYTEIVDYRWPIESLDTLDVSQFFTYRQLAALGAFVKANVGLCKALGESADLEIKLQTFGTPANARFATPLQKKQAELDELEKKAKELGVTVSEAERAAWNGVTTGDRFGKGLDALIKKVDTSYNAAAIVPEKRARAAELKKELEVAKADADRLRTAIVDFDKNFKQFSASSHFASYFSHNILGGTAVKMAEVLTKRKNQPGYELQVAIAYVWSPKLEEATRAIIQGAKAGDPAFKGDMDIDAYLESRDKFTFPPMFSYTDDSGSRWFLGAGYADISEVAEVGDDVARLSAYLNCYASLFLNTTGKERLRQAATAGKLGTTVDDAGVAKEVKSGFEGKQFLGASPKFKSDLEWPLQGGKTTDVRVYVVGVDAVSVADMMVNEAALSTAACNSYLNDQFLRGRDAALKAAVEQSKNDPAAFQAGVNSAQQDVQRNQAARTLAGIQEPSFKAENVAPGDAQQGEKWKVAPGQRVTPGKVKDDF